MVLGCFFAFANAMLKRRASKRFVLAESGQDNVWDSSVDNNPSITVDTNTNDTNNTDSTEMNTQNNSSEQTTTTTTPAPTTSENRLTVPQTAAANEVSKGLK